MSPLQQALKKLRQMKISQDNAAGARSSAAEQQQGPTAQPTRFGPIAPNSGSQHVDDGSRPLSPGYRSQQPHAASMDELDARLSAVRESNHQALNSLHRTGLHSKHERAAGFASSATQQGASNPRPPAHWTSNPLAEGRQLHNGAGSVPSAATATGHMQAHQSRGQEASDPPDWQVHLRPETQAHMLQPAEGYASPSKTMHISARISASPAHMTGAGPSGQQPVQSCTHDSAPGLQSQPWSSRYSPSKIPLRPLQSLEAEAQHDHTDRGILQDNAPSKIPLRPAQQAAFAPAASSVSAGFQSLVNGSPSKAQQGPSQHVVRHQAETGCQSHRWRSDDSPSSKVRLTSRLSLSIGSSTAESPQTPAGGGTSDPRAHAAASSSQDTAGSTQHRPSFAWLPHNSQVPHILVGIAVDWGHQIEYTAASTQETLVTHEFSAATLLKAVSPAGIVLQTGHAGYR